MSNDVLKSLCDSDDELKQVFGYYCKAEPGKMLIAVALVFSTQTLFLVANGDDDTLVLASDWNQADEGLDVQELSERSPWQAAISRPLLWAWRMINQQGYFDGLQLEFAATVDDAAARVQVLVVASELKVRG